MSQCGTGSQYVVRLKSLGNEVSRKERNNHSSSSRLYIALGDSGIVNRIIGQCFLTLNPPRTVRNPRFSFLFILGTIIIIIIRKGERFAHGSEAPSKKCFI